MGKYICAKPFIIMLWRTTNYQKESKNWEIVKDFHKRNYQKCRVSLRTIQRIENGETEPRGDSLKRLANVFSVSPDEIMDWKVVEDRNILLLLNITQFSFLAFPLLGIIIPLTLWILKKDKIKGVDETGRVILNFQITWTLLYYISILTTSMNMMYKLGLPLGMYQLKYIYFGLYADNIVIILVNTVRCFQIKNVKYAPAFNILRK